MSTIARAGGCPIVRTDFVAVPTPDVPELLTAVGVIEFDFVYRLNYPPSDHLYGLMLGADVPADDNGIDPLALTEGRLRKLCARANPYLTNRPNPVTCVAGGATPTVSQTWGVNANGMGKLFAAIVLNRDTRTYRYEYVWAKIPPPGLGRELGGLAHLRSDDPMFGTWLGIDAVGPVTTIDGKRTQSFRATWSSPAEPQNTTVRLSVPSNVAYADPDYLVFGPADGGPRTATFVVVASVSGPVPLTLTIVVDDPVDHVEKAYTFS